MIVRARLYSWLAALPPAPLPGTTTRGWFITAFGVFLGIALTGLITTAAFGADWRLPILMVPLAATSVILYTLPASPLARPWAIVVGNVVSAVVGVVVAHWVPNLLLASGLAVGLAILAMGATRSLHPPGGSTALLAVLGGPTVASAGYSYALLPVGVNSVLLVVFGVLFHRYISGHPYPHVAGTPAPVPAPVPVPVPAPEPGNMSYAIHPADIDAAVARYGEVLDLDREDIEVLVHEMERAARFRQQGATDAA